MDGWIEGWMDGSLGGWMDGQVNERRNECKDGMTNE